MFLAPEDALGARDGVARALLAARAGARLADGAAHDQADIERRQQVLRDLPRGACMARPGRRALRLAALWAVKPAASRG